MQPPPATCLFHLKEIWHLDLLLCWVCRVFYFKMNKYYKVWMKLVILHMNTHIISTSTDWRKIKWENISFLRYIIHKCRKQLIQLCILRHCLLNCLSMSNWFVNFSWQWNTRHKSTILVQALHRIKLVLTFLKSKKNTMDSVLLHIILLSMCIHISLL